MYTTIWSQYNSLKADISVYWHKSVANVHLLSKSYKSLALERIWDNSDTITLKGFKTNAADWRQMLQNVTRNKNRHYHTLDVQSQSVVLMCLINTCAFTAGVEQRQRLNWLFNTIQVGRFIISSTVKHFIQLTEAICSKSQTENLRPIQVTRNISAHLKTGATTATVTFINITSLNWYEIIQTLVQNIIQILMQCSLESLKTFKVITCYRLTQYVCFIC